jgi:DnaK suppressor protein
VIRGVLTERRDELRSRLASLAEVRRDPAATVSFGKRVGDGTTEAVERLNSTSAARSLASMLADVERALEKLDDGSYGTCDRCGTEIAAERLRARPWSVLCLTCSVSRG